MPSAQRVASALGDWRSAGGPLFMRLADALSTAGRRGALPAGGALPAERVLAEELGVSRATVAAAYGELRERGVAATRHGSGTVIRTVLPADAGATWPALNDLLAGTGSAPALIDLSFGVPHLDLVADRLDVSARSLPGFAEWHGYAPLGMAELRARVAEMLSAKGTPTSTEEVLITSGAQEGLALAIDLLGGKGRRVAFESPGYPGALDAVARAGGEVIAIGRDSAGFRVDELRAALERTHVHVVYIAPGCHHPTGTTTSAHRREQLMSLAREHDFGVIEDTALDDLMYSGDAGLPLWPHDPKRVVSIGSVSKVAWGGLRVGWARAPRSVVLRMARMKGAINLGIGALDQRAALALLNDWDAVAAARRREAEEHMRVMVGALRREIPDWQVDEPLGAWSLWIALPAGSAAAFCQLALSHGVMITPGSPSSPDDDFLEHVRVCFGLPPELLEEGARRLAAAWRDFVPTAVPFSTFVNRGR